MSCWLGNAEAVLAPLRREMAAAGKPEGSLLCWPDQFHVGFLAGADPDAAPGARALRVGLSAGDERNPEPYFFVAVQSGGDLETPHPGAVLTSSRIVAEGMGPDGVRDVLRGAIATTRRRISN